MYKYYKVDPVLLAAIAKKKLNLESECPNPPMVPQQPISPELASPYTESTSQSKDYTTNFKEKQRIQSQHFP